MRKAPSISGSTTAASPTAQPRRLESPIPNKDTFSQPAPVTAESAKPSPSAPAAKLSIPSAATRATNDNKPTTNIKVLRIQSELPSDITIALVRYLQAQQITISTKGTIYFELEISGDRIKNITIDRQSSTLIDSNAIAELEKLLLNWRSPNSMTGKIYILLQL